MSSFTYDSEPTDHAVTAGMLKGLLSFAATNRSKIALYGVTATETGLFAGDGFICAHVMADLFPAEDEPDPVRLATKELGDALKAAKVKREERVAWDRCDSGSPRTEVLVRENAKTGEFEELPVSVDETGGRPGDLEDDGSEHPIQNPFATIRATWETQPAYADGYVDLRILKNVVDGLLAMSNTSRPVVARVSLREGIGKPISFEMFTEGHNEEKMPEGAPVRAAVSGFQVTGIAETSYTNEFGPRKTKTGTEPERA